VSMFTHKYSLKRKERKLGIDEGNGERVALLLCQSGMHYLSWYGTFLLLGIFSVWTDDFLSKCLFQAVAQCHA